MNSGYHSIKKNIEYKRVYKEGNRKVKRYFTLFFLKNKYLHSRVGLSVSKSVGNSVTRNRVKRVMREIIRSDFQSISHGYDIVFIMHKNAVNADSNTIKESVRHALNVNGLISNG